MTNKETIEQEAKKTIEQEAWRLYPPYTKDPYWKPVVDMVQIASRQAYIKGRTQQYKGLTDKPCIECKGEGGWQYETPEGAGAERCPHCEGTGTEPENETADWKRVGELANEIQKIVRNEKPTSNRER